MKSSGSRNVANPKLVHLIDVAGSGGAETVFCSLVRYFEQRNQNAAVVLPDEGWISRQLATLSTRIHLVPSRGSLRAGLVYSLARIARASRANVIVAHLLGSAIYAAIVGMLVRVPVVAIFHGALDFKEPGNFAWLKRRLLQCGHVRVIAVSEGVRHALLDWGLDENRVSVIRNGIDTEKFYRTSEAGIRDEFGLATNVKIVGAVGNLHPVKGYELLLDAAAIVCEKFREVFFVVAGEGGEAYSEELNSRCEDLGLSSRFRFIGFRSTNAALYRDMSIFVSAAASEGLPLSFLEAMACEIPIVATANEGSTRLLLETSGGVLVPSRDANSLAASIIELLSNQPLANQFGRNGRHAVCEHYSLVRTQSAYGELIDELTGFN